MIPNNKITSEYVECDFIYDNNEDNDLIDLQPGGVDLNNTSLSSDYQMWELYYDASNIKLKSLTTNKTYSIKAVTGVEKLSFSFTLNMVLTYVYLKDKRTYLNYYDTTSQKNVEVVFDNMDHPKLVYDDMRGSQTNNSDVVFVYVNTYTNKLCCRLQRDRYTIEYELTSLQKNVRLVRVGMSTALRLKFKLQGFN